MQDDKQKLAAAKAKADEASGALAVSAIVENLVEAVEQTELVVPKPRKKRAKKVVTHEESTPETLDSGTGS
jgi:hypothetical protein